MPVIYSNCYAVVRVTAPVFPSLLFPSDRSVNHEAAAWNSQGGTCPSPSSQQNLLVSVCPSTDGWRTASDGGRFWFPQSVTNRQMHSAASSGAAEPTGSADEIVKNNPPRIVSHSSFHCSQNAPPADKVDWSLLNNLAYMNVRIAEHLGSLASVEGKRITAQPSLPPDKQFYLANVCLGDIFSWSKTLKNNLLSRSF